MDLCASQSGVQVFRLREAAEGAPNGDGFPGPMPGVERKTDSPPTGQREF